MTEVLEIVGPGETVVIVDGRDAGPLKEPGSYDYWFDRYFLASEDTALIDRLPGTTEIWERPGRSTLYVLQRVTYQRQNLFADGRINVEECLLWEGLMEARKQKGRVSGEFRAWGYSTGPIRILTPREHSRWIEQSR